jgi:hypothetical protein
MEARRTLRNSAWLAVVVGALIAAPTAGAATLTPTSHNFGNQNVGTSSAPKTFTVTNGCVIFVGFCITPEFTTIVAPTVTPASDYSLVNSCPVVLTFDGATCGLGVTFKPSALGVRNGTLNAGTFSATLTGTGVNPTTPTTQTPAAGGVAGQTAKKKCKKKKRGAAAAAKKCKKKRK